MTTQPTSVLTTASATEGGEKQRLETLHKYNELYSAAEQEFDILVTLASSICETPISLISLITHDRQWFKAGVGMQFAETPHTVSFCQYAIEQDDILEVPDAQSDIRFFQNPYVIGDPKIRFYAGAPIVNKDGFKLGTLCVIDTEPRELTERQRFSLATLSEQVVAHLELRLRKEQLEHEMLLLEKQNKKLQKYASCSYSVERKASLLRVKELSDRMEKALLKEDLSGISESVLLLKAHVEHLENHNTAIAATMPGVPQE